MGGVCQFNTAAAHHTTFHRAAISQHGQFTAFKMAKACDGLHFFVTAERDAAIHKVGILNCCSWGKGFGQALQKDTLLPVYCALDGNQDNVAAVAGNGRY